MEIFKAWFLYLQHMHSLLVIKFMIESATSEDIHVSNAGQEVKSLSVRFNRRLLDSA